MKRKICELAYFGGSPLFPSPLHVGRPNIGDRTYLFEQINDILDRRWLTNNGPKVQEFERRIEEFLDVKHCITTCNATVGLEIASRALDLSGEVIIPSFTFIATAHALQWLGITPVFCDVNPDTHNLDPNLVEQLITPRTSGILGVHVWGRACAVDELTELASRHNLHLLYDAAHAFGASYEGKMIGNFGDAEVFSFHATKFFNTFEGGAIVTNNDELASRIRLMTNFGFKNYDTVAYLGTNGKMNEVSASMGLVGLNSLEIFINTNFEHYKTYKNFFSSMDGITFIEFDEREKNNYQYIVIEVNESITHISRDLINNLLHAENILTRRYFYPGCHQMEPYSSRHPDIEAKLPETERLTKKVLQLPTGTAVTREDITKICKTIKFILKNSDEIQERIS